MIGQTISSSFTPWWKFGFPIPFVVMSALEGYSFVVRQDGLATSRSWSSVLGALVVWTATVIIVREHARYRRVKITDGGLLVSNFLREIRVPFSSVTSVQYDWSSGHRIPATITVIFKEATPLGRAAASFPRGRRDRVIAESIVANIRARAGLLASTSSAPAG